MRRGAPVSPRPSRFRGLILAASLAIAALAGACTDRAEAESLATRAQNYMDLRQNGSWEAVWTGMIDPEARAGLKKKVFMAKRESSFEILDFELVSVDEEQDEGRVVARMDTVVPILKPGGGTMRLPRELEDTQAWVRRDGRWYIQLRG